MPNGSTFVDEIETMPIRGTTMRFVATSGGAVLCFNMERDTAIKAAHDILREVEARDMADLGAKIIPFR